MNTRYECSVLVLCTLLASCGGSLGTAGDAETDAEDTATDTLADTVVTDGEDDTMDPDVAVDTVAPDMPEDTVVTDTSEDTITPDVPLDTAVDTAVDTVVDTAVDTVPDGYTGDGTCSAPLLATVGTLLESNGSAGDDYETTCDPYGGGYGSGYDQFWMYTPASTGTLTLTLTGIDFTYCGLEVMSVCGDDATVVASDCEPYPETDGVCQVTLSVTAGTVYYIVAESHSASEGGGDYQLVVAI